MFGNQSSSASSSPISGVKYNKPMGFVDEYGGNGELTGQNQWGNYFTGLSGLGEGYDVQDVISNGGANPTGFTINRQDPNGDPNYYQQRKLTLNPDGTVAWDPSSNWTSVKQQSQMDHFLRAGLPLALAGYGAMTGLEGALGGAASNPYGAGSGWGGDTLSAMGQPGVTQPFAQLPGYGNTVATMADASGASPFTGGAAAAGSDPMAAYMTSGASEGSTLGNMFSGAGGASGAVGQGTFAGGMNSVLSNPLVQQAGKKMTGNIVGSLVNGVLGGGGSGGISNLGNLGSIFTNYNQYSQNKNIVDQIKGIYSPTGPYAEYLKNELGRKDAAAGRNSQYGPRLAQMLGMLGEGQARALQGTAPFLQGSQGGMNGMVGAGSRLLQGSGLGDWITKQLGGAGGMTNNWNLGPNGGPQMPSDSSWDLPSTDQISDPGFWSSLWGE